jgi:hypothetical protein
MSKPFRVDLPEADPILKNLLAGSGLLRFGLGLRAMRGAGLRCGGFVAALIAVFAPMSAQGDIDFDAGDKHYRLVTTRATWANAKTRAYASTYSGMRGHLATIESAEENAAIFSRLNPSSNADVQAAMPWATYRHSDSGARGVWLGAADINSSVAGANEGNFYWLGSATNAATVQFWQGGQSGAIAGGCYANWGSGSLVTEPDDWIASQDHVAMQIDGWPYGAPANQQCPAGKWNDLNGSVGQAYLIEYDEDPPALLPPEVISNGSVVIRWTSYTNRLYAVQCSTNLLNGFTNLQANIQGTPPINTYTDTVMGVLMKFWQITTE